MASKDQRVELSAEGNDSSFIPASRGLQNSAAPLEVSKPCSPQNRCCNCVRTPRQCAPGGVKWLKV
eukprot:scaffold7732_cov59-Phaeocystis_antarctica.AAC.2